MTISLNGLTGITTPALDSEGNVVVNVSSTSPALRITQLGTGNALLVEDSANPDATPTVVDQTGRLIVGAASSFTPIVGIIPPLQVLGVSATTSTALNARFSNDTGGTASYLYKSRGAGPSTRGIVSSGDTIGGLSFVADDGTTGIPAATINGQVDGTPGTNDMPGRLVFSTTADGASSPTEALRIDSRQQITIGGNAIAGRNVLLQKTLTGSTNVNGFAQSGVVQSDVTSIARGYRNVSTTAAAAFTVNEYSHFYAEQGTIGAGSAITNQYGFIAQASITGATNNYGFHSGIASGTGRWNFYAAGTAANYFAGNVLLNTTTPTGGERMALWYSSNTGPGLNIRDTNAQNGNTFIQFNNGATIGGAITSNGTTTMTYGSASDYRLKDELVPMLGALDKVLLLQPKTGVWKDGGADFSGFVAHELQEVFPDCVVGEKDAVNEDGSPKYQMVDTGSASLIATLTAAIQELNARLKVLEGK